MREIFPELLVKIWIFVYNESMNTVQRTYVIESEKIKGEKTFLVLSDLHGTKVEHFLLEKVKELSPDGIFYVGDMADSIKHQPVTESLMQKLSAYPSYAVFGNHEYSARLIGRMERFAKENGIRYLRGDGVDLGANIALYGLDDRYVGKDFERQKRALKGRKEGSFSILLAHRPDDYDFFEEARFDLVLCGHTHGGQIRIGAINGLYAPGQGIFPKYAGGEYQLGKTKMIVGRGLVQNALPRWGNPPEYVTIHLKGKKV